MLTWIKIQHVLTTVLEAKWEKSQNQIIKTTTRTNLNKRVEQSLFLPLNNFPANFLATFHYQLYLLSLTFSTFHHSVYGHLMLTYTQLIPLPLI